MKIVIAIDSFKGSLSSIEAGEAIRDGILKSMSNQPNIVIKPLADGGEGTVDALVAGMGGEKVQLTVKGPLGKTVECSYGIIGSPKIAVIEAAQTSGLSLVPEDLRNPMNTTTYGLGETIADAINRGCRDFIIGIGGSATNECGIGMLEALGYQFFDSEGKNLGPYGTDLLLVKSVSTKNIMPELKDCNFRIACDVANPLCGEIGASYIYGPQKGATAEMIQTLDEALDRFSVISGKTFDRNFANMPGAGAAGGLGYSFATYLNGTLEPGVSIILEAIDLKKDIQDADFVITGEGKLDLQTVMGKAPIGVAKLAKKYNKRVIAFAGCATPEAIECNREGIDAYFVILQTPIDLNKAMNHKIAYMNVMLTSTQVFNLINVME